MPEAIPVTAENFIRAESDMYFRHSVAEGGFAKFHHFRQPMPIEAQSVVRANRDTLYSSAVFDLDAGRRQRGRDRRGDRSLASGVQLNFASQC